LEFTKFKTNNIIVSVAQDIPRLAGILSNGKKG
jgi:hypothetical protein